MPKIGAVFYFDHGILVIDDSINGSLSHTIAVVTSNRRPVHFFLVQKKCTIPLHLVDKLCYTRKTKEVTGIQVQ